LRQDDEGSQEKIGLPLSDPEEKSLFGIINKLLTNCIAPTLEPTIENIIEKLQAMADVNNAIPDDLQSLIALWETIKAACRRVVVGIPPRQAGQLLDIVNKTAETLSEEGSGANILPIANDLALRLCSIYMHLKELDDFPDTFEPLFSIKTSLFPGDCPLFYITHCAQSIYNCLLHITDDCKKIMGCSMERMPPNEYNAIFEQKHALFREISIFLWQIEQSLRDIAEVFQYTLYADNLQLSIDISCDLAGIVAATEGIQQKFAEITRVLGLPETISANESINASGDCNTLCEYFWKMGECLFDLSSFLSYTCGEALPGASKEYLNIYALGVDNIKISIMPMLLDVSLQAHNKRKLFCPNCDIDEIQASLTFLVSSLSDVSCCLSSLAGLSATLTDISPFTDIHSILRHLYCIDEAQDLTDTLLTINDEITIAENQVKRIMDKTIKMPNFLNSFQKKDPRFITDFLLLHGTPSA
jgi:hypothetical protein